MLILDAFNILHAWRAGTRHGGHAVSALLSALASGRYAGHDITLVCDGEAGRLGDEEQATITRLVSGTRSRRVLYAGVHREADDVIEDLIAESPRPSRLIVVSSDRRVASAAIVAGATTIDSRDFIGHLEIDEAKAMRRAIDDRPCVESASVAWWMNYFGMDGAHGASVNQAAPLASGDAIAPSWLARAGQASQEVDDADLDMERWLREGPKGKPVN